MRALAIWVLLGLTLTTHEARAADDAARARQLYGEGSAHFRDGRIEQAIAAFTEGYRLAPRPEFLLNLSQCYRALGQRTRAIDYLRRFVRAAPDHALRPAAEHTLTELVAAERAHPRAAPGPRAASAPRDGPRLRQEEIAALPGPPPREQPRVRRRSRLWRWVLLGAGIAAAAVGLSLGVYYGTRADEPSELGTLRLPPP